METNEALLIVCDPSDKELGIGMNEPQFIDFMHREHVSGRCRVWFGLWMHLFSLHLNNNGLHKLSPGTELMSLIVRKLCGSHETSRLFVF